MHDRHDEQLAVVFHIQNAIRKSVDQGSSDGRFYYGPSLWKGRAACDGGIYLARKVDAY
jgi:hypothetical protein